MPTTIKLKNSVTTTNAPSSLAQGEVAINITDKKVWVGNAATTPIQLLGAGGSASFTSIAFGAGTVSAPSITFTGDTNTGIYSPAADTIAFTEGGVESMRITSAGNVGIGVTPAASTVVTLQLGTSTFSEGGGATSLASNAVRDTSWKAINTGTSGLYQIGGDVHYWYGAPSATGGTSASLTTIMQLGRGTTLTLQGGSSSSGTGIAFPATQSASSDANTLDDYEEGSFTPTIQGSSTAGTYVYDTSSTFGRYQKVGNRVNFDLCVGISSVTSAGTGNLQILGMPFTPQGFTNYYPSNCVGYFVFFTTGWTGYYISCLTTVGSASLQIYYSGNTTSTAVPVSAMGGVSYLYISGSYLT